MTNIMKPVKNSSDCILKPLGSQKLFSAAPSSSLLVLLPFKNRVQFQESEKKEKKERESLLSRSINSWGKTNEVRRSQPRDVYNPNFYQYSKCYQLNFSWSSPFPPFFNFPPLCSPTFNFFSNFFFLFEEKIHLETFTFH